MPNRRLLDPWQLADAWQLLNKLVPEAAQLVDEASFVQYLADLCQQRTWFF